MKTFLHSDKCRRKVLRESFPSSLDSSCLTILEHNCCDICAEKCPCCGEGNPCPATPSLVEQRLRDLTVHGPSTSEEHPLISVSDIERDRLNERLQEFRDTLLSGASCHLYSRGDMACGLPISIIQHIISECHIVFTCEQFCNRYEFMCRDTALAVWNIVQTTLDKQADALASEYLSDDMTHESEEPDELEEEDFLSGEYAEMVMYSSESD